MEWISVKDKSPEKNQECLTWDGYYIFLETFDYVINDDVCFSCSGTSPTHWMPLPQPPTVR